jgi:hypothetical protein
MSWLRGFTVYSYCSPNITGVIKSGKITWAICVACVGEIRNIHRILVCKSEETRPLDWFSSRWQNDIKMNLYSVPDCGFDWLRTASSGGLFEYIMILLQNSDKFFISWEIVLHLVSTLKNMRDGPTKAAPTNSNRPVRNLIGCSQPISNNRWIAFKPLKPKLVYIMIKNSARTLKRTPHFTVTKINWLTLIKEIIAVYSENLTEPINTRWRAIDY